MCAASCPAPALAFLLDPKCCRRADVFQPHGPADYDRQHEVRHRVWPPSLPRAPCLWDMELIEEMIGSGAEASLPLVCHQVGCGSLPTTGMPAEGALFLPVLKGSACTVVWSGNAHLALSVLPV
eukprot:173455-Pelagomonas_calceolata.AAC.1